MKLYTSGVKVPKLGSVQDRVIRSYLVKESEKEITKTQLLALLVANSVPFVDENAAREWQKKVRKIFTTYIGLEYCLDIPEYSDQETKMIKHYTDKVKHLKPVLTKSKEGKFVVTGLDSLKD